MRSLERHLLSWLLGGLAVGMSLTALLTYRSSLEELNGVFDAHLRSVARTLVRLDLNPHGLPQRPDPELASEEGAELELVTMLWAPDGRVIYSSDPLVKLPFRRNTGLRQVELGDDAWVVYTLVGTTRIAQAAQRVDSRREAAAEAASEMFLPLGATIVLVCAVLVYALRRGLAPLDHTVRDVAQRTEQSLAPIGMSEVPREIAPLIVAINDLMSRLSAAFAAQRVFLADAAHELRTPVTALQLQLQLLRQSADDATRATSMAALDAGMARIHALVEKLLQVARSQRDADTEARRAIPLDALVRDTVAHFSVKADALGIDLGVAGTAQVRVSATPQQLQTLLDNLVENALRYTPRGGQVDVSVIDQHDGTATLEVEDSGPGIPEAERQRVFDRFYRADDARLNASDAGGSGLGLAIVRSIADNHGAQVSLHDGDLLGGLRVRVTFRQTAEGT